jgi:hypothetical protein
MSLRRAFFLAGLAVQQPPSTPTPAGPLQTLDYDDQGTWLSCVGAWTPLTTNGWPGGIRNNTLTYCDLVTSATPDTYVESSVFTLAGTAEEGFDIFGAIEDSGRMTLLLRCLDYAPNTAWQPFLSGIGSYDNIYRYNGLSANPAAVGAYYDDFIDQGRYDKILTVPIIQLRGLPAGRYQFRLVKPVNGNPGDGPGDRRTYFDGATIYTRVV